MLCEGSNPNNKKILRQLKAAHGKQYNVKKNPPQYRKTKTNQSTERHVHDAILKRKISRRTHSTHN